MGFLNIKKENKNKNKQFIKSFDSYGNNNETFVYNSYPNNQVNNQQNQMNYQNNMNPNMNPNMNSNMGQTINPNNMGMNNSNNQMMPNQPMNNNMMQPTNNNVMVNNQQGNYQNNPQLIKPKEKKEKFHFNVIKPKINKKEEQPVVDVLEEPVNETLTETLDVLEDEKSSGVASPATTTQTEQKSEVLDPLNNANNPIPVNPVADVPEKEVLSDEILNAKADILAVLGMFKGMIFKPGETIVDSIKKYKSIYKGAMITLWLNVITLLGTIVVRLVAGSFYRTYNNITGSYTINFNFNNVLAIQNYIPYFIVALLCSLVAVLVITLVYYASSFFNSKGINFGSYLAVSNVAMIPIILGIVVLNPILSIISAYLGIIAIIVPLIYSLISFIIGIDSILKFKDLNSKIYYNVFNLSLVLFIMVLIVLTLFNMNLITIPSIADL